MTDDTTIEPAPDREPTAATEGPPDAPAVAPAVAPLGAGRARRSRRSLFRVGAATGVAGIVGAVAGARLVDAAPWLVVPGIRLRNEIGRLDIRRERPVSSEVRWCVEMDRRAIALTFDDGPDPAITPVVLDALDRHDARATFFVVGALAASHPGVVRDIAARGHEIGNHTWSHAHLVEASIEDTEQEIGAAQGLLADLAGTAPRWFRPPRGQVTGEAVGVAARHRLDIALWSKRFGVREEGDRSQVDAVVRAVVPGDIVLAHDGVGAAAASPGSENELFKRATRSADAAALRELLVRLRDDGWELLTLTELVGSAAGRTT